MVCKRIVSRPSLAASSRLLYLHTIELRRCPAERLGMREFLVGIGARLNREPTSPGRPKCMPHMGNQYVQRKAELRWY